MSGSTLDLLVAHMEAVLKHEGCADELDNDEDRYMKRFWWKTWRGTRARVGPKMTARVRPKMTARKRVAKRMKALKRVTMGTHKFRGPNLARGLARSENVLKCTSNGTYRSPRCPAVTKHL